jgi:hypothetical protein
LLNRLDRPILAAKLNVSINPCHILRIVWECFYADIDRALFAPSRRIRACPDVTNVFAEIGECEWSITELGFDKGETDATVEHMLDETAGMPISGFPPEQIGFARYDVQF